jgi:L-alanine-DL-glutamate epimerase-like enolase superfamily enzyme
MQGAPIIQVSVRVFTHTTHKLRDSDGHTHPGPQRQTRNGLLTITTEDGLTGHALCPPEVLRREVLEAYVRPVLLGADPTLREALWQKLYKRQRGSNGQLTDKVLSAVEMALWDLAGRRANLPVWRMIGGYRDKVPAYGSTMCGDDLEGGLKTPEDYGRFADWLKNTRGYQAIKLHTWMPPVPGAPSVAMDIKACAAVREAVGPDYPLMLDASHWYSRREAIELGRGIQALGFAWFEEPMEEASISSYAALARELEIPVVGPETASGKHHIRAEWITQGACDILRTGVHDVGGIWPALKCMHLAESFNMECEVHSGGVENLTVLACAPNGRYYERGLLHPFLDHDQVPEYLNALPDPMDHDGFVAMPTLPGLGLDINFDWIANTLVEER